MGSADMGSGMSIDLFDSASEAQSADMGSGMSIDLFDSASEAQASSVLPRQPPTGLILLVRACQVALVHLVYLVHLVGLIQENKREKPPTHRTSPVTLHETGTSLLSRAGSLY